MAEDQNQSDFDELLGMYSGETTEGDSSSDSSNDFDDLLSIYSEEDVKKKVRLPNPLDKMEMQNL